MKTIKRALVGMVIIMMVSVATAHGQTSLTKTTTVTTTTTKTVSGGDTTVVTQTVTTTSDDPWMFVGQVFRQVLADSIRGWDFDAQCDTLVKSTESIWKQMHMDSLMVELKNSLVLMCDTVAKAGGESVNTFKKKVAESTKLSKAQADSLRVAMRKTTAWVDTWLNVLTDENK